MEALRYDVGKPRVSLVPPEAIKGIAMIYTWGAGKYAEHNWRKGMAWSRMYDSAMRHLLAFWEGQDLDQESGMHHLMHAAWNVIGLWVYTTLHPALDDRVKSAPVSSLDDWQHCKEAIPALQSTTGTAYATQSNAFLTSAN